MVAIGIIGLVGLAWTASLLESIVCGAASEFTWLIVAIGSVCGALLTGITLLWRKDRSATEYWMESSFRLSLAALLLLGGVVCVKAIASYSCGKSMAYVPLVALSTVVIFGLAYFLQHRKSKR